MDTKTVLDNVKSIKNADGNKYILNNGTFTSTLIGGGIGFLIAYNHKHNLLMGTIIGAMIAGFATNILVNKNTTKYHIVALCLVE